MKQISLSRRAVLQWASAATLAALPARAERQTVNVGLAGATEAGLALLRHLVQMEGVAVSALFEQDPKRAMRGVALVGEAKRPAPKVESSSIERFCQSEAVQLVINAALPHQSAAVCLAAMRAGKPVAAVAPAAQTLEECWSLVETSTQTGCDAILMEASCYRRESLLVLNLIAAGLLGEPLFVETGEPASAGWWLDINRGDCIEYLVAPDSKMAGHVLARTARGRVLYASSRHSAAWREGLVRVQGTHGVYSGMIHQIYLDGRSPIVDEFEPLTSYQEFEPAVWKSATGAQTPESLALRRLIHNIANRLPPDADVFDLATFSALPLMAKTSAARGGESVDFPDFTRGRWRKRSPIDAGSIA